MTTGAVGIDLGTTYSAIAIVNQHGIPEVLPNAEGDRITPSVILFEDDNVIVGTYAKQAAAVYPDQVVEFVKRHMSDPDFQFDYRGRTYDPTELSSFILSKLKKDAEARLGHPVEQAVITVPAYFNDIERRATLLAGQRAGLHVLKLVNEPTSAAIAYGLEGDKEGKTVMVFDLGGGTFDASLVEMGNHEINVIATNGDPRLGGKDWDDVLIQHVAEKFTEKHGVNPLEDLRSHHDLRAKCVSAKISLTRRPKINIFHDCNGKVIRQSITRELFEELSRQLLDRCERLATELLADSGTSAEDVDVVLLAGGSTRMPMVRQLVRKMFAKAPSTDINPDECVALGAALTAAVEASRLTGEESPVDLRTHDVTSHSLGLAVYKSSILFNSKIIGKNSRIPANQTREDFTTTHDNQASMDLWLVQGESDDPVQCTALGHFEFYGIPPRPAGETRLAITYRYNANGIVEVEAMDLSTGQLLPHRMSGGEVSLGDIAAGHAPLQVALVVDCSGSMFGLGFAAAISRAKQVASQALSSENRQLSLITVPGGVRAKPTRDLKGVHRVLDALVPVGSSTLGHGLARARSLLRPRGGQQRVIVLITDGLCDDPEVVTPEAHRLRATGARVLTVGVGDLVRDAFLKGLATSPKDYYSVDRPVEIEGAIVNLVTLLDEEKESVVQ